MPWKNAIITREEKQRNSAGVVTSIYVAMTIADDTIVGETKSIETIITGKILEAILTKPTPAAYKANMLNYLKTIAKAEHVTWLAEIANRAPPVEYLNAEEIVTDLGTSEIT